MEKDWFERKVGIRLHKRVENVTDNGHLSDVWEIRWDNLRYWEILNPDEPQNRRKTLPSEFIPNTRELRDAVWNKITEKLNDGWSYASETLLKLKAFYFVEDGVSDNDDLVYVIYSSEEGSKEVFATFNRYFPESREMAEKLKNEMNSRIGN